MCDKQERHRERDLDCNGDQDAGLGMASSELENPKNCEHQAGDNSAPEQGRAGWRWRRIPCTEEHDAGPGVQCRPATTDQAGLA